MLQVPQYSLTADARLSEYPHLIKIVGLGTLRIIHQKVQHQLVASLGSIAAKKIMVVLEVLEQ